MQEYEYQMPSQISKITVRRCHLFKCHCNEIYFVFFQKSLFLWHIHYWQDLVSSDISSAGTIPKGILATESLIISLITMTYSLLKRVSLWWHTFYHSKTFLSNRKSLSWGRAIYDVQQIIQQYRITNDLTVFKIYNVQQIMQQYWIMEDFTDFEIVCLWGTLVILTPLHVLLRLLSLMFSNLSSFHKWHNINLSSPKCQLNVPVIATTHWLI